MKPQGLPCALENRDPIFPLPLNPFAVSSVLCFARELAPLATVTVCIEWTLGSSYSKPAVYRPSQMVLKQLREAEERKGGNGKRKEWKWVIGKQALSYLGNSATHNESFPASSAGI